MLQQGRTAYKAKQKVLQLHLVSLRPGVLKLLQAGPPQSWLGVVGAPPARGPRPAATTLNYTTIYR